MDELTVLYVDILDASETINVSLNYDAGVSIWNTGVDIATTSDDILLVNNAAHTANLTAVDAMSSALSNPYRYTPGAAGTYRVELNATTNRIDRYDITVTANNTIDPDPTDTLGRLWSYQWIAIQRSVGACTVFCESTATDADLYVVVPASNSGENFIWQLDLNNFAGGGYTLASNSTGLDAPYAGISAPEADSSFIPEFPVYLSYPALDGVANTVVPTVNNLSVLDDAGQDEVFTPGASGGLQDTVDISFTANVTNANYSVIIDITEDGIFGTGDVVLLGKAQNGLNTISWDGTTAAGALVPAGTYAIKVEIRLG